MKKALALILAAAALTTGCAYEKNTPLKGATPDSSALEIYYYNGENTRVGWVFDDRENLVDEFNSAKLKKAGDVDISELPAPFYGVTCHSSELQKEVGGVFCNGYWVSLDGEVYKTSKDISYLFGKAEISEGYTFDGITFPAIRYFALEDGVWDTRFLNKAAELEPQNIELAIVSQEGNKFSCTLTNNGAEEEAVGKYFSVQAEVSGEWYDIPTATQLAFEDIAFIVEAGGTFEITYDITPYGELPAGKYRLVAENSAAEFTV